MFCGLNVVHLIELTVQTGNLILKYIYIIKVPKSKAALVSKAVQ